MLIVDNLNMKYPQGFKLSINKLTIKPGTLVGILGPNGSGKSTFFDCLIGFNKIYEGRLSLSGYDLRKLSIKDRSKMVSYHQQESEMRFPLTVFDVILMGRHSHSPWGYKEEDKELVDLILQQLCLEKYANVIFNRLSGGEKQMVLLARMFVQESRLMLFDEPNNNLDVAHIIAFMGRIKAYTEKKNTISIIIMHDINAAIKYCDKIMLMKSGNLLAMIDKEEELKEDLFEELYDVPVKIREFENGSKYVDTLI